MDSSPHSPSPSLCVQKNRGFANAHAMIGLERKIKIMVSLGIGLLVLHVVAFNVWVSHLAIQPGQPAALTRLNGGLLLALGLLWLWTVWEMAKGSWAWVRLLEAHSIWVRNEALNELRQTLKTSATAKNPIVSTR